MLELLTFDHWYSKRRMHVTWELIRLLATQTQVEVETHLAVKARADNESFTIVAGKPTDESH